MTPLPWTPRTFEFGCENLWRKATFPPLQFTKIADLLTAILVAAPATSLDIVLLFSLLTLYKMMEAMNNNNHCQVVGSRKDAFRR